MRHNKYYYYVADSTHEYALEVDYDFRSTLLIIRGADLWTAKRGKIGYWDASSMPHALIRALKKFVLSDLPGQLPRI